MIPFRLPRPLLLAIIPQPLLAWMASAHPGHDHSDIPSVIRHPFAGIEHGLIVAALVAVAIGVGVLAVKAWRSSSRHDSRSRRDR